MDLQASVDRVERELVRLGEHGLDTRTWCRAADALLGRLVGFDGSCWHTIDPATVLITSHLTLNLPSRFPLLAANEVPGRRRQQVRRPGGPPPPGRAAQPGHRRPAGAQPALAGDAATRRLRRRAAGLLRRRRGLLGVADPGPRPRTARLRPPDHACRPAAGRHAGHRPAPHGGRPPSQPRAADPRPRTGRLGPPRPDRVADPGRPPLAGPPRPAPAAPRGPGSAPPPASGSSCTAPAWTATPTVGCR
jgi:hypothetical protein